MLTDARPVPVAPHVADHETPARALRIRRERKPADVLVPTRPENVPVASALAGRHGPGLCAVFGYARLLEDLGEETGEDRGALLDWVDRQLDVIVAGGDPGHPLLRELARTVRVHDLPADPLRRLVVANRRDQVVPRYETFDDLLDDCRRSAAPVGELVLRIFGSAIRELIALSDLICAALQIAGHLQDVAVDRARGRIYLPQADMRLTGCRDADLTGATAGPALRALLALEAERARALLTEGAPLVGEVRGRARLTIAGLLAGGRAALDALQRADFDVLSGDPRPSRRMVAIAFAGALIG